MVKASYCRADMKQSLLLVISWCVEHHASLGQTGCNHSNNNCVTQAETVSSWFGFRRLEKTKQNNCRIQAGLGYSSLWLGRRWTEIFILSRTLEGQLLTSWLRGLMEIFLFRQTYNHGLITEMRRLF